MAERVARVLVKIDDKVIYDFAAAGVPLNEYDWRDAVRVPDKCEGATVEFIEFEAETPN